MPTRHHLISFCLGAGVVIVLTLLAILPTTKPFAFLRLLSPFHVFASDEPLTLESVFAADKPWTLDLPWDETNTILATGDVSLGREVNAQTIKSGDNIWPFRKVLELLNSATITYINLEAQLTKNCPVLHDGMRLCGGPGLADGLAAAGIDLANVANNHAGDVGADGITDSLTLLEHHYIAHTGTGQPVFFSAKGTKFAFLGYNSIPPKTAGISWADRQQIAADIQAAKQFADIVIVQLHWGVEYQPQPTQTQQDLGRFLIDSGADAVIGNHPHRVQPMELYKGKPIFYSLGNFIFDQEWSQQTKQGMAAKLTYRRNVLVDIQLIPIDISNYGQASEVTDPEKRSARLNEMMEASKTLLEKTNRN